MNAINFYLFFSLFFAIPITNIFSSEETKANSKSISKKFLIDEINNNFQSIEVETFFGKVILYHPLLKDLHDHVIMQRLKNIDQSGPGPYLNICPFFSRYDHSMGVLYLLQKAGRPLLEQIAGMLHDTSHTVFSHLADTLFNDKENEKAYQDKIHSWYLEKQGILEIIENYDISLDMLDPDREEYKALEEHLPFMCADRIQYNIQTGVIFKRITKNEATYILNHLSFDHIQEKWFFTNQKAANLFGSLSLYFTENLWGAPENGILYSVFSSALKKGIDLNLISFEDIHFGIDKDVFAALQNSNDLFIQSKLLQLKDIKKLMNIGIVPGEKFITINEKPKFRGIDPLVLHEKKLCFLTDLDEKFKLYYNRVKEYCENGYSVLIND